MVRGRRGGKDFSSVEIMLRDKLYYRRHDCSRVFCRFVQIFVLLLVAGDSRAALYGTDGQHLRSGTEHNGSYAPTKGGRLYRIDEETGTAKVVGPLLVNGLREKHPMVVSGLAYDPTIQQFWAVTTSISNTYQSQSYVVTIDPFTAHAAVVGEVALSHRPSFSRMAVNSAGELYTWASNLKGAYLGQVNRTTLEISSIGEPNDLSVRSCICFDDNDVLHLIAYGSMKHYTVGTTSGDIAFESDTAGKHFESWCGDIRPGSTLYYAPEIFEDSEKRKKRKIGRKYSRIQVINLETHHTAVDVLETGIGDHQFLSALAFGPSDDLSEAEEL